jgi:hypothetical protein
MLWGFEKDFCKRCKRCQSRLDNLKFYFRTL